MFIATEEKLANDCFSPKIILESLLSNNLF